jgi:ribosomal protein S20
MSRLRTMIKKVEAANDRTEAQSLLNETKSFLDKLTGKGVVKAKKAANTKSKLERKVNAL